MGAGRIGAWLSPIRPAAHGPVDRAVSAAAPSRDSATGYRPALDGIRAVAVLAVIAYHLGYRWAPGGFLGVDVFFVLSGYLITSLLLAEHAASGGISLLEFWLRRARRLLPALFVMLTVVAVGIGLTASPFEMPLRREDLIWTIFYGSNWHFVQSGQDYFAQYGSVSPLRHTWSLAIEEQFYVVWPLLVTAALWFGRGRPFVLAILCIAGIAVSVAAMAILFDPLDPSRAYYGTDARMHQLLVGSLLAVLMRQRQRLERFARLRRLAAVVGAIAALLLLASFAMVGDHDSAYYRGFSVLLSITTAALVLAVELDPRQPVARLLSMGPVAWIGKISYGLYLWHWPVILAITSAPPALNGLPGTSTGVSLIRLAATFGIATASFYAIEQPIRRCALPVLGRSARRFAVAAVAAVVVVSGVSLTSTAADARTVNTLPVPDCPPYEICVRHQGQEGAPVIAVVGDSIARSMDPGFMDLAAGNGWTYLLEANYSCKVAHLRAVQTERNAAQIGPCYDKTPGLQAELLAKWHPDVVVMVDYMDIADIADEAGRRVPAGTDRAVAMEEAALTDVARTMTGSGSKMALLKLPPSLPGGADCQKPANFNTDDCTFRITGVWRWTGYDAAYERIAEAVPGVSTLSITSVVCPESVCRPLVSGVIVRSDGLHYTEGGAKLVMSTLSSQIEAIIGEP